MFLAYFNIFRKAEYIITLLQLLLAIKSVFVKLVYIINEIWSLFPVQQYLYQRRRNEFIMMIIISHNFKIDSCINNNPVDWN